MTTWHLILLLFTLYTWLTLFPKPPVIVAPTVQAETTIMTGKATWYDYDLKDMPGFSKTHSTCALRIIKRYQKYKVCNSSGDCIVCLHNDYWPKAYTEKIIDLSSYAFRKLAPLRKGVIYVTVEEVK